MARSRGNGASVRKSARAEVPALGARPQATDRLLREVIGHAPIILFSIDNKGIFTLSEGKGLAVLGLKPGEAVGQSVFEMYAGSPGVLAQVRRALKGESFVAGVEVGGVVWETHYGPIRSASGAVDGLLGVAVDVTERKRAEALLHQQSAAIRASMDGMAIVDAEGRFVYLNDAYAKLHGYANPEQLVGKPWRPLYPADEARRLESQVLASFGRVGQWRGEATGRRRDGSAFSQELSLSAIEEGGFVFVVRDITERKAIERERERVLEVEKNARAEAELASRSKDEFLAMISHELRTPMTAMLGWTWLLRGGSLVEEERARAIDIIERNMRLQKQIIEDLLDVSSIVTGRLRLETRLIDLRPVIEAAVEVVRPSAGARSIRLELALEDSHGPVTADPDRLQQVVWNLLSNAVKFTPEGGSVRVWTTVRDGHAEVHVADTGQGITAEFMPHVFERFRQAESAITRSHRGLGLGLAIVKHIVEMHGGTVGVESAGAGRGTHFFLSLPLAPQAKAAQWASAPAASRVPAAELPSLRGVKVLVVDDEEDSRAMVAAVLSQCGARIREASSADEALRRLEDEVPDVLVSDISMPGQDGYELMRRIRSLPADRGGQVPAAALTAGAKADDRTRALLAGYQIYIPKPVEPTELAAVVGALAGRSGR